MIAGPMISPDTASAEGARTQSEARAPIQENSVLLVGLDRLSRIFESGLDQAGLHHEQAHDGQEAVELAWRLRPVLILVGGDRTTEAMGSIHELRTVHPEACILFLSPTTDHEPALQALAHGADDVVPPPHSVATVLLRSRVLWARNSRGDLNHRGASAGEGRVVVDRLSRTILGTDGSMTLTGREFELLERLLEANGKVVRRETILSDIWGSDQDSDAVLDATVHRLRRKLEEDPAEPSILTTIRGIGYRVEAGRIRFANSFPGP